MTSFRPTAAFCASHHLTALILVPEFHILIRFESDWTRLRFCNDIGIVLDRTVWFGFQLGPLSISESLQSSFIDRGNVGRRMCTQRRLLSRVRLNPIFLTCKNTFVDVQRLPPCDAEWCASTLASSCATARWATGTTPTSSTWTPPRSPW